MLRREAFPLSSLPLLMTSDDPNLNMPCQVIRQLRQLHQYDQNFPLTALEKMNEFLDDPDIMAHPERHADLIHEIKVEAVLATENSPYAEVRANVDPTDDPTLPSFTIRTWVIGIIFSGLGAFVNQLFNPRQPSVYIPSNVAQLLACKFFFSTFPSAHISGRRTSSRARQHHWLTQ